MNLLLSRLFHYPLFVTVMHVDKRGLFPLEAAEKFFFYEEKLRNTLSFLPPFFFLNPF